MVAALGGWLGHSLSARRDFINERRKLRINYLLEAYRRLESGSNRGDNSNSKLLDVESAIADIQLLGSPKQACLAREFAQQIAGKSIAPIDHLINDLRQSLRTELNLGSVTEAAAYLRFHDSGAQNFDTTLIATIREVNNAKIESAETAKIQSRQRLDEHKNGNDSVAKIVKSWSNIESIIIERLRSSGVDASDFSSRDLLENAQKRSLITENQFRSLRGLNIMRNLAAHGDAEQINEKRAEEFLTLADAIKIVLEITDSVK